jgi:hypothetical protein
MLAQMADSDDDFASLAIVPILALEVAQSECGGSRPAINGTSSARSSLEHHYVCERARAARAKKRNADQVAGIVSDCAGVVSAVTCGRVKAHVLKKQRVLCSVKRGKFLRTAFVDKSKIQTHSEELQVAFHRSIRTRDVARSVGLCKSSVGPTRIKVAYCVHEMVLAKLRSWQEYCSVNPPLLAFHGRKYDSATFWLQNPVELPGLGVLSANKTARPIHCYVQRRFVILVWDSLIVDLYFPVPTLPASTTNAECVQGPYQLSSHHPVPYY